MPGLHRRLLLLGAASHCWSAFHPAPARAGEGEIMPRIVGANGTTFIARLRHAPFPYDGKFGDSALPFFDTVDARTGARLHTTGEGERFAEAETYRDDRVLFHLAPGFDARRRFAIVLFFHGHGAEIKSTVIDELDLPGQVARSGRNLILVAPQLALRAADSSPGKLFRRGALALMMEEAAQRLAGELGRSALAALRRAPLIVSAFSGGYRAAAFSADRGGVENRLAGMILFDALYGDRDLIERWLARRRGQVFFASLFGESTQWHQAKLAEALWARGLRYRADLPARLGPGQRVFARVDSAHGAIPIEGPPVEPLSWLLARLPERLAFISGR